MSRIRRTPPKGLNPWDGYSATFLIPVNLYVTTRSQLTELARANRRRQIRSYARTVWKETIGLGAWRVGHYVALISVPESSPSLAAETIKPIIDAGTDCGLWPDDDAYHRKSTVYTFDPHPRKGGVVRITVSVLPVAADYQIPLGLGTLITRLSGKEAGYSIGFHIPNRLWVTSNLTDSDIKARQSGAHKAGKGQWGKGKANGVRERILSLQRQAAMSVWASQKPPTLSHATVVAGVGYALGVDKTQADPDNAAETVTNMLAAAVEAGILEGDDSTHISLLAYYRLPVAAQGGWHDVQLAVFPTPTGFQPAAAVAATTILNMQRSVR